MQYLALLDTHKLVITEYKKLVLVIDISDRL